MSVLLRPRIPAVRLPLLPLAAGLAAADAIRAVSGLTVDLRWPNDLLIGPRKAGGILVEAKSRPSRPARSHLPSSASASTCISAALPRTFHACNVAGSRSGRRVSPPALLVCPAKIAGARGAGLLDPAAARTIPRRVEAGLDLGARPQVEVHGPQACTGVTAGLDEHGFLLVRTDDGLVTVQTGGIRAARMI